MENSSSSKQNNNSSWVIVALVFLVAIAVIGYFYQSTTPEPEPIKEVSVPEPVIVEEEPKNIEPEIEQPVIPEQTVQEITPEPVEVEPEIVLPTLDESDNWIREKLPTITWRNELLKLIVDDDMVRRFVVFTDNFAKGDIAYRHSILVQPTEKFSAQENTEDGQQILRWDENVSKRFSLYVDLLRTIDSDLLVQWYVELKPLIDEAYSELGYVDEEFTDVLHDAISRVLDMEIPKEQLELVRPSVMYKYKDQDIEQLTDADKLLLRIGKDNLLVIKSVLLEINEKLSRTRE
ncbi:DUF3014 domain-containing protein [Thalassotalea profundi]|uniref:DUF3014 domain-containing protein n=1 Tax=Thalassotalea profundi TaxID=2036687 RepID=A0ABQ3IKJ9_9GAMM|nr:DUF3014 domain-containing protein [Thalassotalea profundi]GHE84681.1 hypothetical protein GCM10011501_11840 [Thalassotalea profundi]